MGKWSKEEEEKLLQGMKMIMNRNGVTDFNSFNSWTEVSHYVETRTDIQCRNKWYLRFFIQNEYIYRVTDMIKRLQGDSLSSEVPKWEYQNYVELLTRMMALCHSAADETEVLWDSLVGQGECWTGANLRSQWLKLRANVPNIESLSFQGMDYNVNLIIKMKL